MTGPRILFVVDAGPAVGGGHVMRSLTLARALVAQGAACVFLGPPMAGELLDAFAPDVPRIADEDLAAAAAREAFDAIVFDHYGLAEPDHRAMARGRPVLVIDDLADRPLGADIVLDSGPERKAADYLGLTDEATRLLLGPTYAPVRPEFAALREPALAWRGEPVLRILVAMGLTDVGGITGRVVDLLRPRIHDIGLDVVLGGAAPSLPALTKIARRDPRLSLHVDTPHMARLTAEADVGVGAAGSSTWERCVVGLPSLMVVLADNQRGAARAMAEREAALVANAAAADFDQVFDRHLMRLLRDASLRRQLAATSAGVCDGLGAGRVAEAFLNLIGARDA
ncbi:MULTISPECIES: UDP-2,4-diacetamido-2,4,6-trideoxy-beta-L-altropyranose hydrolase [unclassified Phenylobacterium]|uniref:UDP-2,4-diacetamido-2,4, 6-trideoxy-beta-L-altropyranose hydrolase n=1 Tax=unclassified Phenylobacterium TaxID=2640670 RepID=UPI00083A980A|nr:MULTISPECIES: UDP-2,4-diacetamido-2,4,6-trideoxy-beta-L-altropyranose hydrolase [unclassified Phenylobacterium]